MNTYRCDTNCGATFEHPDREDDCGDSLDGGCPILVRAGWRPVWIRISTTGEQNRHLLTRGGWMCPACVKEYARMPARRPKRRRAERAAR